MKGSVILGQYVKRDSIIHYLDPRSKILSMIIIMLSFITLESTMSYMIAILFVLFILILTNVPFKVYVLAIKPLFFILIVTFLYHMLLTKGSHVILDVYFLTISVEGIVEGIRITLRIMLFILLASVLTFTTKPLTLAHGLVALMKPLAKLNFPVEKFALMIIIAIRFIPTILQELQQILTALKAKGNHIETLSLRKKLLTYNRILIPLLMSLVIRAEQLSMAIEARGFGDGKNRVRYHSLSYQLLDYQVLIVALLFSFFLLYIKVYEI